MDIEDVLTNFSRIYLGGIPPIITNDSAFLSFVCVITATEALCGYLNGKEYDSGKMGALFKDFVREYFPDGYRVHADDLWEFRNKIVHAFSTGKFLLTHHNSQAHLTTLTPPPPAGESDASGSFTLPNSPFRQTLSASGSPSSATGFPEGVILNAEDFYAALLYAAQRYFTAVRQSANLQAKLRERLAFKKAGALVIREFPQAT